MLVRWMDTLRPYIYTGRHRALRPAKPAITAYAGPANILIK